MLTYRAIPLGRAGRFVPPMLEIMAEADPAAADRVAATEAVLSGYRDRAFVVLAIDAWRLAGAAVWTSAANRVWPNANSVDLEAACGFPVSRCATLINLFVRKSHRGRRIGAELEGRMFAQMGEQGHSHMLNFAYGTPGIRSFLLARPGARVLEGLPGKDGHPVIIAPV
jgi:GNAT superfamily N-acetyltransferase